MTDSTSLVSRYTPLQEKSNFRLVEHQKCTYKYKNLSETCLEVPITRKDHRIVNIACDLSDLVDAKYRIVAIANLGGKRIEYGMASRKTHPIHRGFFSEYKLYLHAETDLLRKISVIPKGSTIAVIRTLKSGKFAPSFPCDDCFSLMLRKCRSYFYLIFCDDSGSLSKILVPEDLGETTR